MNESAAPAERLVELCRAVHTATMLASPPPCHAEGLLSDGRRHRCRMNVSHHGVHRCYCTQDFPTR